MKRICDIAFFIAMFLILMFVWFIALVSGQNPWEEK